MRTPEGQEGMPIPGRKDWGGLARRGANRVQEAHDPRDHTFSTEAGLTAEDRRKFKEREARRAEERARQDELRAAAREAVGRVKAGKPTKPRAAKTPKARDRAMLPGRPRRVEDENVAFARLLGPKPAEKELRQFRKAVAAYQAERYTEARKPLAYLAEIVPTVPVVREMYGLTLYRLERWKDAANELEVFREQVGTTEQNPVLADCYRAMGRWADVEVLWEELAEASPSGALVTEGRIVAAGALADQGKLREAVQLLGKNWRQPKRPKDHQLRRAYALADLYERSGDLPRARALFGWLGAMAPDYVDVEDRLASLR